MMPSEHEFESFWFNERATLRTSVEMPLLKELARRAFLLGWTTANARSRNYTANSESAPTEVAFANGRCVRTCGSNGDAFLDVIG
jgi:hypothetical protein